MGSADGNATDDKSYHESIGVTYQPFSQFCGPCCYGQPADCTWNTELLTGEMVTTIGDKYGKLGSQVSLRWLTQQGMPVIPRSDSETHLLSNMDIFDWTLSDVDMYTLTASPTPPVCGAGDWKTSGDCPYP